MNRTKGFAPASSGRLGNEEVQVVDETLAKLNWSVLNTFVWFVDGKQVLISSSSLSVSRSKCLALGLASST